MFTDNEAKKVYRYMIILFNRMFYLITHRLLIWRRRSDWASLSGLIKIIKTIPGRILEQLQQNEN